MCTALVPTIALHLMQRLCAALVSSAAGYVYRVTGPFDSSMNTSTRAHSDIRTIYTDTVEHARLFESISSVQRYSLQRSMRANMRSARCARFMIMCAKRQAVHERKKDDVCEKAGSICSRMSAALVHSTYAQHLCRQLLCT